MGKNLAGIDCFCSARSCGSDGGVLGRFVEMIFSRLHPTNIAICYRVCLLVTKFGLQSKKPLLLWQNPALSIAAVVESSIGFVLGLPCLCPRYFRHERLNKLLGFFFK